VAFSVASRRLVHFHATLRGQRQDVPVEQVDLSGQHKSCWAFDPSLNHQNPATISSLHQWQRNSLSLFPLNPVSHPLPDSPSGPRKDVDLLLPSFRSRVKPSPETRGSDIAAIQRSSSGEPSPPFALNVDEPPRCPRDRDVAPSASPGPFTMKPMTETLTAG